MLPWLKCSNGTCWLGVTESFSSGAKLTVAGSFLTLLAAHTPTTLLIVHIGSLLMATMSTLRNVDFHWSTQWAGVEGIILCRIAASLDLLKVCPDLFMSVISGGGDIS